MDCQDYITELVERKKGQHLQREERGAIQHLKNAGYSGAKFSPFIILYLAISSGYWIKNCAISLTGAIVI